MFTGVNDLYAPDFLVFPNPAEQIVRITYPSIFSDHRISLLNASGELIATWTNRPNEIDLVDLGPGMYVLRLEAPEFICPI